MKNNFNTRFGYIALLIFSVVIGGCNSDPSEPSNQLGVSPQTPWFLSMPIQANYGHFYVTSQSSGVSTLYNSGGLIYSSTAQTQTTNGGVMTASSLQIAPDSNDVYFATAQPVFGSVAVWGLSGNISSGIPSFSDTMYVPDEIVMTFPTANTTISKSAGVTVTWNQDTNNDTVAVWLQYDYAVSRFADSTISSAPYSKYWLTTDNGQFQISTSQLSSIPTGGYASIIIARGNSKLIGPSTHKFVVYGATTASGVFKVVQ